MDIGICSLCRMLFLFLLLGIYKENQVISIYQIGLKFYIISKDV